MSGNGPQIIWYANAQGIQRAKAHASGKTAVDIAIDSGKQSATVFITPNKARPAKTIHTNSSGLTGVTVDFQRGGTLKRSLHDEEQAFRISYGELCGPNLMATRDKMIKAVRLAFDIANG